MKKDRIKLIKSTIIFIVILVFILIIINTIYTKSILEDKELYRKEKELQKFIKSHEEIKFAFFGDSHANRAVNPEYINESYNFGRSGENYAITYYRFKKMIEQDKINITYAILEVDKHTFARKYYESGERVYIEIKIHQQYMPKEVIKEITKKNSIRLLIKSKFIILGEGRDLKYLFQKPGLTVINGGWSKDERKYSESNKREKAIIKYNIHFGNETKQSEEALDYFKKIVLLAQEKGVKIVLIKYPISKEYKEQLFKNNFDEEEYSKSIDLGIKTLDYIDIYDNHEEFFSDEDHLNTEGAEDLSKRIQQDLKQLSTIVLETINETTPKQQII